MVSVIVPVYKVERYLNRCVESIRRQTYKDIEIILVDDGSPDNCGKMCDDYAKIDNRIKVVHKENGGLSDARNFGIDASKGEYIAFVDSDDYISDNFIEVLYDICINNNCDISQCYCEVTDEDNYFFNERIEEVQIVDGKRHIEELLFNSNPSNIAVWTKLYKRELFNEIKYPVGKIYEDNFVNYKLFYNSNRIGVTRSKLYAYYQSPNSITRSAYSKKNMDIFEALDERREFFMKNQCDKKWVDAVDLEIAKNLIYFYSQTYKNKEENRDVLNYYMKRVNNIYSEIIKSDFVPLKTKASYLLFRHFNKLYIFLKK